VWLRVKERRLALNPPLPPKRVQPKVSPAQSPVAANHPVGSSAPTHQEEATPLPEHQTTLSIALDAKNTVENPSELQVPNGTASIRAVVSLEKNQLDSYRADRCGTVDRKSTRLNSSHLGISYAVFCLKKKTKK